MKTLKSSFSSYIGADAQALLQQISQEGFLITIVGGTVRDFYLKRVCKKDFDIEVRFQDDFENALIKLEKCLSSLGPIKKASYSVLTLSLDCGEFEFSFPRIEKFSNSFSHSNFEAEFIPSLKFEDAVKRRDFTINAIGMELVDGEFRLNDPLKGVQDIKVKIIRPCSTDFAKDPVRFLRAIRFGVLLDFELEDTIQSRFPAEICEPHYFVTEAQKSENPFYFLQKYFSLTGEPVDLDYPAKNLSEIKEFYFLKVSDKERIARASGYKLDKNDYQFPLKLKGAKAKEILLELKKLQKTPESIYKLMHDRDLVDINYQDFISACSTKVDLSSIPSNDRERYKWDKILELF